MQTLSITPSFSQDLQTTSGLRSNAELNLSLRNMENVYAYFQEQQNNEELSPIELFLQASQQDTQTGQELQVFSDSFFSPRNSPNNLIIGFQQKIAESDYHVPVSLDLITKKYSQYPDLLNIIHLFLFQAGEFDHALKIAEILDRQHKATYSSLFHLGVQSFINGQYAKSISYIHKLQQEPTLLGGADFILQELLLAWNYALMQNSFVVAQDHIDNLLNNPQLQHYRDLAWHQSALISNKVKGVDSDTLFLKQILQDNKSSLYFKSYAEAYLETYDSAQDKTENRPLFRTLSSFFGNSSTQEESSVDSVESSMPIPSSDEAFSTHPANSWENRADRSSLVLKANWLAQPKRLLIKSSKRKNARKDLALGLFKIYLDYSSWDPNHRSLFIAQLIELLDPSLYEKDLQVAVFWEREERLNLAQESLNQALLKASNRKTPDIEKFLENRKIALIQRYENQDSVIDYLKEEVKESNNALYDLALSEALFNQGKYQESQKHLDKIKGKLDPQIEQQKLMLEGSLLYYQGYIKKTDRFLEKALERFPDNNSLKALQATVWIDQNKNLTQAESRLDEIYSTNPNYPGLPLLYGKVYLAEGRYLQSQSFLRQAVRDNPKAFYPLERLAHSYYAQGRLVQTAESYQKALDLAPSKVYKDCIILSMEAMLQKEPLLNCSYTALENPYNIHESNNRLTFASTGENLDDAPSPKSFFQEAKTLYWVREN